MKRRGRGGDEMTKTGSLRERCSTGLVAFAEEIDAGEGLDPAELLAEADALPVRVDEGAGGEVGGLELAEDDEENVVDEIGGLGELK